MDKYLSLIESLNLNIDSSFDGDTIQASFHYKSNRGFFHLKGYNFSLLLLKNIHKDFVRIISGQQDLDNRLLSKISDFLSNIEKNSDEPIKITFYVKDDEFYITDIKSDNYDSEKTIAPFEIPYPLTKVEYNLFKEGSEKNLYSRTIFDTFFPDNLTYLTNSIIKNLPDIFNPLFIYSNFKTYSPSVKTIFNRPYFNLNNIEIWSTTLGIGSFYYNLNFAQHLYLKENYRKIKKPDMKLLNLDFNEFLDIVKEIKETTDKFDEDFLLGNELNNFLSLYIMAVEMLNLYLMQYFLDLLIITDNLDSTLKMIYQTRRNSIVNDNILNIYNFFDINAEFKAIHLPKAEVKEITEHNKHLPKLKKLMYEKKIINILQQIHHLLNIRDELFINSQKLLQQMKSSIDILSDELIKNMQIKQKEDIYFLELDEIKQIKDNNFYGNIAFNLYFRKAQFSRFQIQQTPTEIYEKDIDRVEEISKNLYEKAKNSNHFRTLTFFYKDHLSDIAILKKPSLFYLDDFINKDAIITQNIPIFSLLMEFCTLHEKTVFTGIKMPDILLKDKKLILKNGEVLIDQ
ncbi:MULTISPECIES: hypothetical protein [Calditerrivibrio]